MRLLQPQAKPNYQRSKKMRKNTESISMRLVMLQKEGESFTKETEN